MGHQIHPTSKTRFFEDSDPRAAIVIKTIGANPIITFRGAPRKSSSPRFPTDNSVRAACATDPRIHFALVCGAKSCPPIRIFKPSNLDRGLRAAAHHFCCDNVQQQRPSCPQWFWASLTLLGLELCYCGCCCRQVQVDVTGGVVTLSKIFQWYGSDFAPTEPEILQWITECMLQAKVC